MHRRWGRLVSIRCCRDALPWAATCCVMSLCDDSCRAALRCVVLRRAAAMLACRSHSLVSSVAAIALSRCDASCWDTQHPAAERRCPAAMCCDVLRPSAVRCGDVLLYVAPHSGDALFTHSRRPSSPSVRSATFVVDSRTSDAVAAPSVCAASCCDALLQCAVPRHDVPLSIVVHCPLPSVTNSVSY